MYRLILLGVLLAAQNPVADANDKLVFDQAAGSLTEVQSFAYKYYLDGDPAGVIAVVVCSGTVTPFTCAMPMPALSNGTHTIQFTATNVVGESVRSAPFRFRFRRNLSSAASPRFGPHT